ncbi:unnamed protein product [Withania somnifera]
MKKIVYRVWNFVDLPRVYLHDEGYFTFLFNTKEDRDVVTDEGTYTYDNRPMQDMLRVISLWVKFPGLPIVYWTEENLGRIASYIGKEICTDRMTLEVERVSYARVLIETDIT